MAEGLEFGVYGVGAEGLQRILLWRLPIRGLEVDEVQCRGQPVVRKVQRDLRTQNWE